jgi:SAM-dependent methyltransferase
MNIELAKCNACNSEEREPLFDFRGHGIVKCAGCNLVYMRNPLSPEDARAMYNSDYVNEEDRGTLSQYASGADFRLKEANRRLDQMVQFNGDISYVLDVGCGPGFFLIAASQRGIDGLGVDISENAARFGARKGVDIICGDLLDQEVWQPESFDAITFWASLEHLYRPRETLERANRLLKPDGLIAVETVDIGSLQARFFGERWRLLEEGHNFYFSSDTLDAMLKRTGFTTLRTEHDGFVESVVAQLGLRDHVVDGFARQTGCLKRMTSAGKEYANRAAAHMGLGDVVVKYARKS